MKQLLLLAASLVFTAVNTQAQLGIYEFSHTNGNSCSSPILTVTSQPSNAVFSAFSRNSVSCQNEANVMNSRGWTNSGSINTSQYIQFSITANAGHALTLTSISLRFARNNHGPQNIRIAHNHSGNFTTDIHNFTATTSSQVTTWNFSDFTTAQGATVTFRIYGWNAGNSASGTFYVDDVALYGTVSSPPVANAGSNSTFCFGSSATMTGATASGTFGSISWTGGEDLGSWSGSGNNPATYQFTPSASSGSFTATLTVFGSGDFAGTNVTSTRQITWYAQGAWIGSISSDWFTAGNWCSVPDANTDVIIPEGTTYAPVISADGAVCRDLTINSGAGLTINSTGKLHIKGNFTNNGNAALGAGSVVFSGSMPQNISGNNNFENLEFDNGMLVQIISGTQNITGIVNLTNGLVYTYGNSFVLKSTPTTIAQIAGGGYGDLMGNVTVERYIPAASGSIFNHLIASPVTPEAGTGIAQLSDDFNVVLNNYGSTPAGTLFQFNEAVSGSGSPFSYNCFRAASEIEHMAGYAAYIPNATTFDISGTYHHHVSPIKNLSYNEGSGGNGWNLIGNPYPSGIDWDLNEAWVKYNVTNSIYIWNPQANQFSSYNGSIGSNGGSRYIAPMQAFFVVATGPLAQVQALHSTRVTSPTTFFKTDEISELIRLKVTGNGFQDETVVYFNADASEELDNNDSYKLKSLASGAPLFASRIGNNNISINTLPSHNTETIIPLFIEAVPGNYSITAAELIGFGNGNPVYLEDAWTGNIVEITENFQYDFYTDGNDNFRFSIKFDAPVITGVENASTKVNVYQSNGEIVVETSGFSANTGVLNMINSAGQIIMNAQPITLNGTRYTFATPDVAAGIYFVNLQIGNEVINRKLYIRRSPVF